MNPLLKELNRLKYLAWAKTGRAPGYLYSAIEKFGQNLDSPEFHDRKLYNGIVLECDLRDHVQQQIYFFGGYEPIEASLFLSLIQPGDCVLDIGANIGFYTLMLSQKVGENGQVHSFEPVPKNFSKLKKNIQKNGNPKNIHLNQIALWDQEDSIRFSLGSEHEKNCGGFSAGSIDQALETFDCPATTLKKYAEENKIERISAMKMDIEGAELKALTGALAVLEKDRPTVLLEVCSSTCANFGYTTEKLWDLFAPLGYSAYRIGSTNSLSGWIKNFSGISQANVLLMQNEKKNEFITNWDDKVLRRNFLQYPLV